VASVETGTATPRSPVAVTVRMRGHDVVQDKPAASGGKDEGPMASELLLASLLACQHSTFVKVAAKRRLEASLTRLEGELHFDDAGEIARAAVRFVLHAPATVADAALETAIRLTDGACTISKALKVPVHGTLVRA
jgi:uncharacterized OsmC-like protein